MIYGYVRVSTREQNASRQMIAMEEFGVSPKNIFIDKQSGKDFERPQYKKLIRKLKPNDVVVFKSIDRMGRNYDDILEQWKVITKNISADIVVIDMPILDTRKSKDLVGTLISDIVLQLLSYVAQTEREFIRQRQAEGIAAAKARGVKFGRMPKERPDEYQDVLDKWRKGDISARAAGRALNVSHATFLKWVRSDNSKLCKQDINHERSKIHT